MIMYYYLNYLGFKKCYMVLVNPVAQAVIENYSVQKKRFLKYSDFEF